MTITLQAKNTSFKVSAPLIVVQVLEIISKRKLCLAKQYLHIIA